VAAGRADVAACLIAGLALVYRAPAWWPGGESTGREFIY